MKIKDQQIIPVLLFSFSMLLPGEIPAQSEFGVKGGILFSTINATDNNSNLEIHKHDGVVLGAFYKKQKILGPLGVQTEILYQQKGADFFIENTDFNENGYNQDILSMINSPTSFYRVNEKLHYVSVPLMLDVNTTKFLDIYAGPEIGYLISQKTDREETDELSRFSAGVVMGATLRLCENSHLDFRYSTDFTAFDKLGRGSSVEMKNRGFTITLRQTITIKQNK